MQRSSKLHTFYCWCWSKSRWGYKRSRERACQLFELNGQLECSLKGEGTTPGSIWFEQYKSILRSFQWKHVTQFNPSKHGLRSVKTVNLFLTTTHDTSILRPVDLVVKKFIILPNAQVDNRVGAKEVDAGCITRFSLKSPNKPWWFFYRQIYSIEIVCKPALFIWILRILRLGKV